MTTTPSPDNPIYDDPPEETPEETPERDRPTRRPAPTRRDPED